MRSVAPHRRNRPAELRRIDDGLLLGTICRQCRACLCCTNHDAACSQRPVIDLTHEAQCPNSGTFFARRFCPCRSWARTRQHHANVVADPAYGYDENPGDSNK